MDKEEELRGTGDESKTSVFVELLPSDVVGVRPYDSGGTTRVVSFWVLPSNGPHVLPFLVFWVVSNGPHFLS